MLQDETVAEGFTSFVAVNEHRLRHALIALLGADAGREAAADALAYAWEHWDRVHQMENPVGYLYVVGRDMGRRKRRRRRLVLPVVDEERMPWVEPALPRVLSSLSERERMVVVLLHGYGWVMSEVADTLGISKGSVQTYAERAMGKLRRKMGAER